MGKSLGLLRFARSRVENILVVKGTMHTGIKDIRTKATVITLASKGIGQFKKSLKKNWKKINNLTVQPFSGSKSADRF